MNTSKSCYQASAFCYLLFAGYWALSFFEGYISGSLGAISRYYIAALILFLLLTAKGLRLTGMQVALAIWAIYYALSLMWSPHPEQGRQYFFSVMGMAFLLILIMGLRFERHFVNWCIHMTAIFSLLLGVLGLFYSRPYDGWIQSRQVLTLLGVQLDPNNLVALYAYGVGLGLYFFLFDTSLNIIERLLYGVASCINVYDILMCGSRSGIVVLAALILILLVFQPKSTSKTRAIIKKILIVASVILIASFLFSYLPPEVWTRISGQDENLSFLDSTGRTERWIEGLTIWWNSSIVFGCGWGAFECHGTFFTFLVDTGLLGITLFGGCLVKIILNCIRKRRTQALLIIASGIIPSILIGAQNRRFFWNAILLPVMIISQYDLRLGAYEKN